MIDYISIVRFPIHRSSHIKRLKCTPHRIRARFDLSLIGCNLMMYTRVALIQPFIFIAFLFFKLYQFGAFRPLSHSLLSSQLARSSWNECNKMHRHTKSLECAHTHSMSSNMAQARSFDLSVTHIQIHLYWMALRAFNFFQSLNLLSYSRRVHTVACNQIAFTQSIYAIWMAWDQLTCDHFHTSFICDTQPTTPHTAQWLI